MDASFSASHVGDASPRLSSEQTRLSLDRVIFGWVFGAIFFHLASGPVYASFVRQLGVSESVFGFLAGIYPLFGFLQLPAARLLQGRVRARSMFLWAGLSCRFLWVLAAALPIIHVLAPDFLPRRWLVPAFVACLIGSSIGQAFTGPPFFAWMSELVPGRVGPSFWARRHFAGTCAGIAAILAGGFLADSAGWVKTWSNGAISPLLTYSAILIVAALCGVMDIAVFVGVREPPQVPKPAKLPPLWTSIGEPLREKTVRNYLAFTVCSMLGFASLGSMLTLFCLEHLDFSRTQTGFLLTICPLAGMALTAKWWGAVAKVYGTRPMVRFASIGLILVPLAWIFAVPENVLGLGFVLFVSGMLAMAYEISNLNFMTRACPHLPRPMIIALFAIGAGTTFALTSTLAGFVVEKLPNFGFEILGMNFSAFHLIFAFSLLVRIFNATYQAPRLEEETATGTRETVNELGANLAQGLAMRFARFSGGEGRF